MADGSHGRMKASGSAAQQSCARPISELAAKLTRERFQRRGAFGDGLAIGCHDIQRSPRLLDVKRRYADGTKVIRHGRCDRTLGYRQNDETASRPTPHLRDLTVLEQSHSLAKG